MPRGNKGLNSRFLKSISNDQIIICILLVILVVLVVYYVNQNNTEQFQGESPTLYFFYVDWCPHCTSAKPKITELKNNLQNNKINNKTVNVEFVNCEEKPELAKQYNVRAYPTLYLVNGEEKIEYGEGVSVDGLTSFLNKNV
jgi:thiol-disulfide isomerase/thioredoxin